ncbi:MAG: hypothetical protein IIA88_11790 [Bacteroidetes bacterium]|nr:hypothetical protein [Bacteroidota bacterium]
MSNTSPLIRQLKEEDLNKFVAALKENGADKTVALFNALKRNNISDFKTMELLGIKASNYYTLKSRLHSKLQDFLINNMESPKTELLRNVANIPNLIFKKDKDTATAILTKLEKDLKGFDLPNELTSVYSALKKLHANSQKYYDYSQLYNQHVAYHIAIEKVEDLIIDFNKKLGLYLLSRNNEFIEHLKLIKQEIANTNNLYKSHRLSFYKGIIDISFILFVNSEENAEDEPIEDILTKMEHTINNYQDDINYKHLALVYYFLKFEYYHQYKIYKKEEEFFHIINNELSTFLLYNFVAIPSFFLLSKAKRYSRLGIAEQLYSENQKLSENYTPDISDEPNYINYKTYLAISCFYANQTGEALTHLNQLRNSISFKNYPHAELEVKLLLASFYTLKKEYDLAWNILRSVERKANVLKISDNEQIKIYVRILKVSINSNTTNLEENLFQLTSKYKLLNQGKDKLLEYLDIDVLTGKLNQLN